MQSSSRLPHLVRGSSAAAIATFAALFSHVIGGGAMPGPVGIAVPLLLSLMVCILLAGRRLSLMRLSISVIASQTLFHTLFVLGTPTPGAAMQNMPAGHHHGHGMMQMPAVSEHTITLVHGDTVMWISHLIGALVTVAFLYRGEQTIHRLRAVAEQLVAWVRHRLTNPIQLPVRAAPTRVRPTEAKGWTVLPQIHASTLSRRGPPTVLRIAR